MAVRGRKVAAGTAVRDIASIRLTLVFDGAFADDKETTSQSRRQE